MTRSIGTILLNARLIDATAPDGRRPGDAVAVSGGRITAVGTASDLLAQRASVTQVLNLKGAFLMPGLVDSHAHPVSGNDWQVGVDLAGIRTLDEMLARIRAEAARTPPGSWVRGHSLDPICYAGIPHVADAIEDAVGGRPASFTIFDYHGLAVSRSALALAGITGPREFTGASVIVCDEIGKPTGVLLEPEAIALVRDLIPAPRFAERAASLRRTLNRMAAHGLTGLHVMPVLAPPREICERENDRLVTVCRRRVGDRAGV